ncbi:MAG: hypothetical protein IJ666_06865 [Ruminococcus sp.]|nr:hypothetical protein [Ruminococcus sp.]
MLEIQEKLDISGYESLVEKAGIKNLHITEALSGNDITGFIAYAYDIDQTIVYDYDDGGDIMLCDGLVRSVMFKSVLKGIESMEFLLENHEKYINLIRLKFLAENENICENLSGFMNSCQDCMNKREN